MYSKALDIRVHHPHTERAFISWLWFSIIFSLQFLHCTNIKYTRYIQHIIMYYFILKNRKNKKKKQWKNVSLHFLQVIQNKKISQRGNPFQGKIKTYISLLLLLLLFFSFSFFLLLWIFWSVIWNWKYTNIQDRTGKYHYHVETGLDESDSRFMMISGKRRSNSNWYKSERIYPCKR